MQLKVCGLRDFKNVQELTEKAVPDFMGFIFFQKSSRAVDEDILLQTISSIPSNVKKVGVFVNETTTEMIEKAKKFQLDYLQLHGDEPVKQCEELERKGQKVIKAFGIKPQFDFDQLQYYAPHVSFFLFDTKGEKEGGNGYTFDWQILNSYDQKVPFFLSGGISLDNVEQVRDFLHLNIFALDVNSKFEVSPGLKDISQLKALKNKIKDFN